MANNTVDLKFVADSTPIVQANKRLDTMGRTLEGLIKKQNEGAISDKQFAKAKKELRRSVDDLYPSWNRAKSVIDNLEKSIKSNNATLAAEKEALRKAKEETKAFARARREAEEENRRFDRSVREQARSYENLRRSIDPAYASAQKLRQAKEILKTEFREGRITLEQYLATLKMYRSQAQASSQVATEMGRRLSRNGVLAQQAGYQIGDFIVQVQSGQNVMVAFGQQATQMAGTLTMLGGRMVAIGTGLGIAIPLVTAFGAAWMRSRKAMEESKDSTDELIGRIESLDKALDNYLRKKRASQIGFTVEQLTAQDALDKATEDLARAQGALLEVRASIAKGGTGFRDMLPFLGAFLDKKDLKDAQSAVRALEEEQIAAQNRIVALRKKISEEQAQDQADFVAGLQREATVWAGLYGQTTAKVEERLGLLKLQDDLVSKGIKLGSREYTQAVAAYQLALQNEKATRDMADAIDAAKESYSTLVGQSSSLDLEIAKVTAQIKSVKEGSDSATAAYIAGERAKIEATTETTRALAIQTGNLVLLAETAIAYSEAMAKIDTLENLKTELAGLKGSSGGSKSKKDPLKDLQKQLDLERELVGVSEERARVIKALGSDFVSNNPKIVQGLEEQIIKTKELNKAEEERKALLETVESSMEDGFMSMVDGTKSVKDAFRDMARSIIKELYDVLVVQRLVGSFESGGGGILGGVFSLFGKASGGTVQANQPYLVGEKGPELIVPRNRGHVMNADLTANAMGGGETVVVNQNFNFQANGDESVKKIIAQAAPSIANMAKQSVMDARRRGGAMKNTFG